MRITWFGHSCFEISDSIDFVIDPHDGMSIGLRRPDTTADIVAITHDRFDHNRTDIVSKPRTIVIKDVGEVNIQGFNIKGFEAFHEAREGLVRGKLIIYRITMGNITALHVGDLRHVLDTELIETIGEIDILFVPVGGKFTLDSIKAVEIMRKLNPQVTIPMHYHVPGITLSIDGVASFIEEAGLPVLRVGNAIDFFPEDLPGHKEIWVFDY